MSYNLDNINIRRKFKYLNRREILVSPIILKELAYISYFIYFILRISNISLFGISSPKQFIYKTINSSINYDTISIKNKNCFFPQKKKMTKNVFSKY